MWTALVQFGSRNFIHIGKGRNFDKLDARTMAAIEDVDYLWENSEKDAHLIYLDSERRDKRIFPYPNQYTVEFQTPIKLVYGYDVLDAMIPTTMFNVEKNNNRLVVGVIKSSRQDWEFDSNAMYEEFAETAPEIIDRMLDPSPGKLFLCNRSSMDMYGINYKYVKDTEFMFPVVMTDVLPVSKVKTSESDVQLGDTWYCPDLEDASVVVRFNVDEASMTVTIWSHVYVSEIDSATISQTQAFDIYVSIYNVTLPVQNYENTQLQQNMSMVLSLFDIQCEHTSEIPDQANKLTFSSYDPFFFNMKDSTCSMILGFDELSELGMSSYMSFPLKMDPDRRIFASRFDQQSGLNQITSPGLLNLHGVRFLVLRCPELEAHAFSGKTFTRNTTGLGIFKLVATTNGISSLRFDYTNFVVKPFHPIGKLCRLSVRFEQSNGELYDFKGVNHHILLSIKYLVPSVSKTASIALHRYQIRELNEEYDPNVMQFLMKSRKLVEEETTKETQEDTEDDYLSKFSMNVIKDLVKLSS